MNKEYFDVDGNPQTIYWMVKNEPEWAMSIIPHQQKRIAELEAENHKARELIDDLIQAALNDCVESIEWGEVEERARAFLINQSEEGKDD